MGAAKKSRNSETVSAVSAVAPPAGIDAAEHSSFPTIGLFVATITYLGYFVLISVGHLRDFIGSLTGLSRYRPGLTASGYGVLVSIYSPAPPAGLILFSECKHL